MIIRKNQYRSKEVIRESELSKQYLYDDPNHMKFFGSEWREQLHKFRELHKNLLKSYRTKNVIKLSSSTPRRKEFKAIVLTQDIDTLINPIAYFATTKEDAKLEFDRWITNKYTIE